MSTTSTQEAEIENDIFEEQGLEGEALTKRQLDHIIVNMRETKNILYSGELSPVDAMAYILAMQRLLLDGMKYNTKKYSSSTSFTPEKLEKFEEARKKLDSLWDTVEEHSEKLEEGIKK